MITDLDVVATINQVGGHDPDVIPALYENEILKPGSPVICSRWGIQFIPEPAIDIDPKVLAIHESGHAVIYLEFGEKFEFIEIDKRLNVGYTKPIYHKDIDGPTNYKKVQAISLAGGPIATSKLLHGNYTTWTVGALDDFVILFSFEKYNGYDSNEYVVREASKIIEKRWNVVEAIAEHLLKYNRLRCAQCLRIRERIINKGDNEISK